MEKEKIYNIIDIETRALVGIICKRVEVLDKESALTPNLYKALSKELIYEYSRNLKKLLDAQSKLFKLEFKARQQD